MEYKLSCKKSCENFTLKVFVYILKMFKFFLKWFMRILYFTLDVWPSVFGGKVKVNELLDNDPSFGIELEIEGKMD